MNRRIVLKGGVALASAVSFPLTTKARIALRGNTMTGRLVETSTIKMNVREEGRGPAVLLCHGFPETSYSWRHQVTALAGAGYRAIAPDMRGYGASDRPDRAEEYSVFHLVGDMVALLDALDERDALIVGNDWGATVAWQAAQMRPDRFRGVVAMSVPLMGRSPVPPTQIFPQNDDAELYTLYFQKSGVAEAEFERDTRSTLRKLIFGASGNAGPRKPGDATPNPFGMVSRKDGLLMPLPDPHVLPTWISETDLDVYVRAFELSGFRGGLNYYRNLDRNWELQAALTGVKIEMPALFIAGERDTGLHIPGMLEIIEAMPTLAPHIRPPLIIEGGGHWLSQERPERVNAAIIEFAGATLT